VVMGFEVVGCGGCGGCGWVSCEGGAISDDESGSDRNEKLKPYLGGSWRGCGHQILDLNSKSDDDTLFAVTEKLV
jgi:hypothetical protein